MKTFALTFLFVILVSIPVMSQPIAVSAINEQSVQTESQAGIYAMPAPYTLHEEWRLTEQLLKKANVENQISKSLKKTSAWGFTVGQADSLWATNLNSSDTNYNTEYKVFSHCRAVGNHCYIFVEDSLWTNSTVIQSAVDSVRTAFEIRTPGDATKGVFQLDTMYFGNPPDADDDPKILILILDIKDGFSGSGGYIAGYFYAINEYSDADIQKYVGTKRHSNEAEIFYIDANPANLKTTSGVNGAASTTAHEFQHMINWNYDGSETTFINEGMSESASVLCGYGLRSPALYYSNTNVDFLSWGLSSSTLRDYSRTAFFSWYLVEQFGNSLTKQIVQSDSTGITGYNLAFQTLGSSLRYNDVLKNFAVAIDLNNTSFNSIYGFTISVSGEPSAITYTSSNVPTVTDTVQPYGTRYIKFTGTDPLSLNVNSSGTLGVKAIATGTAGTRVDSITLGSTYSLSDFGTNYTAVVLAVTNLTNTATVFTYAATPITGVEESIKSIPLSFVLDQNYPNPFNPSTKIQFQLPSKELAILKVYDMLGREVAILVNGIRDAGNYTVQWNAANLSSGVYWYRLTAGSFVQTNKMLLLK